MAPAKASGHLQERPRAHQCALILEETYFRTGSMARAAEHMRIMDQRAADVIPHEEERGFVFAAF